VAWPRATSLENIASQVGLINVPTVVIAGELDKVDTIDTLRRELLTRIPHASLEVVPSTGHLSMLESPEDVAQLINDFVKTRG
jgi:pimeloyl-ACP methyl ester carboxylesterase